MSKLTISVVCPVHNEEAYLPYSLASLKDIEDGVDEKIFVLDNCTDNSECLIEHAFPDANIFHLQKHKWKFYAAESFQHGFDQATGDIIWAIGADLYLYRKIPEAIRNIYQNDRVGTTCFQYLNYDLFNLWLRLRGHYTNVYKRIFLRWRAEVRHTGFYALRRKMMEEIGGLADIVSEYDEYCLRSEANGWQVVYVPYTPTYHLRPGLSAQKQYGQGVARYYLPAYGLVKTLLHSFIHLKPHLITGYLHAKKYGLKVAGTLR